MRTPHQIQTEQERLARFHRWALQDFYREIEQGYPLMRTIHNDAAQGFLKMVESRSLEQQKRLARAFHPMALSLSGEMPTPEDDMLREEARQFGLAYNRSFSDAFEGRRGAEFVPIRPRKAAAQIVKRLLPVLGKPVAHYGDIWEFVTPLHGWFIKTHVYAQDNLGAVEYSHLFLITPDEEWHSLPDPSSVRTNFLNWLHISQTYWYVPFECDVDATAQSLERVCRHFFTEMNTVLEGLSPDPLVR